MALKAIIVLALVQWFIITTLPIIAAWVFGNWWFLIPDGGLVPYFIYLLFDAKRDWNVTP